MGSFWGHVDEGIFFIVISVWWMFHLFPAYIKKRGRTDELRFPMSFGMPGRRHIPIEIYFKTGFPIFGFIAEILAASATFHDKDGNFMNLTGLQHMTIYGIFIIHGLADLFLWFRWPIIKNANYLSLIVAFTWYGVGFIFHANMAGKEPLEAVIHLVPLPVLLAAALCAGFKILYTDGIGVHLSLAYLVFTLGTWFIHAPFMLYVTNRFPGEEPNDWDRSDPRNVAFAVAMFGAHLCFNVIFMAVLYVIIYCVMTRKNWASPFSISYEEETNKYQKLPQCDISESSIDDSSLDLIKA